MTWAALWRIHYGKQKRKLRIQLGGYWKCEKWLVEGCVLKEERKELADVLDVGSRGFERYQG